MCCISDGIVRRNLLDVPHEEAKMAEDKAKKTEIEGCFGAFVAPGSTRHGKGRQDTTSEVPCQGMLIPQEHYHFEEEWEG
jgi:hypothetical protein